VGEDDGLHTVSNCIVPSIVRPRMGGERKKLGCRPAERRDRGGKGKTRGVTKGVKTVVDASTVVGSNLFELDSIGLEGD